LEERRGYVDMARQGCSLSEHEVKRIVRLLANTDMTIFEVAQRMTCSRGTIAAINRRFQVRKYAGPKGRWILANNTAKML
jgi:hypothetical protein